MYQKLIDSFYENQDAEKAEKMSAYLKNQFPFLGIQKPLRNTLQKEFLKNAKKKKEIDWDFVFDLWNLPQREFQYLALDYLIALKNCLKKDDMNKVKLLITQKSWWDTVDGLASHLAGTLCSLYPELVESHITKWRDDSDLWLIRTSILFQLKYKETTDTTLLQSVITKHSSSKEFFITKAIGWILREYSKTNKERVRDFMETHTLQPLSIREGSKYL